MKVIIVGGVAGGATAAARIRRLDEHAEITVFERSGYISYANCGLPYYIGDVITDPEELTLQTPESFFKRFHINMKIYHEVISIHPDRRTVSVKNLENGEIFEENYDKLILSPGAKPTQPRLPGVGIDKLFTLRTCLLYTSLWEFQERAPMSWYTPPAFRRSAGAGLSRSARLLSLNGWKKAPKPYREATNK